MKVKVQVQIESNNSAEPVIEEIFDLTRDELTPETLGLTLDEAKTLLANLQAKFAESQTIEYVKNHRQCLHCGKTRATKDHHELVFRTLFGKLRLESPRFYTCDCQPQQQKSESPLAACLPDRTAPELKYLQTQWVALMPYGVTVKRLEDILPIDQNVATLHRHVLAAGERVDNELGDEQPMFAHGCIAEWESLPEPDPPLVVGIDGGYVHARDGDNRKAGWFEVIVGKSMTADGDKKCFAFVADYNSKPKRRLYETFCSQGLQMNQTVTFLSDGGDTVRDLQFYMSPFSEHLLDWFHITMRITVIRQMAKGLPKLKWLKGVEDNLERVKWFLWHGNVFMALQVLDDIEGNLECLDDKQTTDKVRKFERTFGEFRTYIERNEGFIVNYRDRYFYGKAISTAFVESAVNQVISKRMVKKQQMHWTKKGAHLLLQVRTRVINDEWRDIFHRWYPKMHSTEKTLQLAA